MSELRVNGVVERDALASERWADKVKDQSSPASSRSGSVPVKNSSSRSRSGWAVGGPSHRRIWAPVSAVTVKPQNWQQRHLVDGEPFQVGSVRRCRRQVQEQAVGVRSTVVLDDVMGILTMMAMVAV